MELPFVKFSSRARSPVRSSPLAAGLDLAAATQLVISPGGRAVIPTDIAVEIPPGHYGRIAPRSGLAMRWGVNVGGGVIDEDFCGPIQILLMNHGTVDFRILVGDRIAQLILEKISYVKPKQIERMKITDRNDKGFGSTGTN